MRMYETTTTISQNDVCGLQRYAYLQKSKKLYRGVAIFFVLIGLLAGLSCMGNDFMVALVCIAIFCITAVSLLPLGKWSANRFATQYFAGGDEAWTDTTWFTEGSIHRLDDEDGEIAYPLKDIVYGCHKGEVLLLCTRMNTVIPVNWGQLSDTDRESVAKMLEMYCPKLVFLE